ncbi:hypothetical protein MMC21_005320 [Puttea exsequens]|nr:hypothetical protein [Puttea exsequens]
MGQRYNRSPSIGINVRTFQNIDPEPLKINVYDGAALEPAWTAPKGLEFPENDESLQTFQGSCHCGKVSFALRSKPIEELEATECNCALCLKTADLWLYPHKNNVIVQGREHLTLYSRYYDGKNEKAGQGFCSTCGVCVINVLGSYPGGGLTDIQPVNARAINGIDIKSLKVKKANGKGWGEPYALDKK